MKRIVGTLTAIAALVATAAGAQAAIVYEKGGSIYTASNSGKNSKLLVAGGRDAGYTPNGQTVVYSDKNRAIFAIPAVGGTPVRLAATDCSSCYGHLGPDNTWFTFADRKGVLTRVPLDGGPAVPLATGVETWATVSPDSTQVVFDSSAAGQPELFTVPAAGGTPTKLALTTGLAPMWSANGVVATTFKSGKKPQAQVVLLDAAGNVKRVLRRKEFASVDAFSKNPVFEIPFQSAGQNIVTLENGKGNAVTIRLVGLNKGTVKAQRTFKNVNAVQNVGADGKTILTVSKGKLQSVSFRTGKRTTLIKTGVKSAFIH